MAEAGGEGALDILFAGEGAKGGGGEIGAAGKGADAADEFVAVLIRHADVAEQDVGMHELEKLEGIGDAAAEVNAGAVALEHAFHEVGGIGFVFDDEDGDVGEVDAGGRRLVIGGRRGTGGGQVRDWRRGEERERDTEGGAAAEAGTVGADFAAVEFDELHDDRETEAEAAVLARGGGVGLAKAFENVGQKIGGDAGAVVLHAEEDVGRPVIEEDVDLAADGRELDRVGQEVPDDLLQPGAVAHDFGAVGGEAGDDANAFGVGGGADRIDRGGDDHSEVDALDEKANLAGGDPAHVEQVLDELGLDAGVALDDFEAFGELGGRVGAFLQDLGPAEDRVEGSAELVGEGGEEIVLQAAGAFGLGAGGAFAFEEAFAFGGGGVALGDVAHDFREADAAAEGVGDDGHESGDVEAGAVLAHVPAVVGGAAGGFGGGDFLFGFAAGLVFGGEQDAGGAAENIVAGVAEEAFGAGVPVGDEAVVVEEEDGVIGQAIDDESVAGFAFEEFGLDRFLACDVERDAFEMGGLAGGIAKGAAGRVDPARAAVGCNGAKLDVVARAVGDGALDGGAHVSAVVGMDAGVERGDVDGGIGREEKLLFAAIAPGECAVGEHPGKCADLGGLGGEVELLAQVGEALGGVAELADVEQNAGEADGFAGVVAFDMPAREHAARVIAVGDDAVFDFAAVAANHGLLDAAANKGGIFGVNGGEVGVEGGAADLIGRDAKPAGEVGVAADLVGGKFPDPGGDLAGEHGGFDADARFLQGAALLGELAVGLLELLGAAGEIVAGGVDAGAERLVGEVVGAFGFLKANPRSDVFDPMDDVGDLTVGRDDGDVAGAPETLLETAAGPGGAGDVVARGRDLLRLAGEDGGLQRVAMRFDGIDFGRGGVIGKNGEDGPANDLLATGVGGAEVGLVDGDDGEVGIGAEEEIGVGSGFEDGLKIVHARAAANDATGEFRARGERRVPRPGAWSEKGHLRAIG